MRHTPARRSAKEDPANKRLTMTTLQDGLPKWPREAVDLNPLQQEPTEQPLMYISPRSRPRALDFIK